MHQKKDSVANLQMFLIDSVVQHKFTIVWLPCILYDVYNYALRFFHIVS